MFRPGLDNSKLVRRQQRFQAEIESLDVRHCTAELPKEHVYFIDLTRLIRLCGRLPTQASNGDAINEVGRTADIGVFFE